MDILMVTGMSGAGKSQVINNLEDIGYYCVDNMPVELLEDFVKICQANNEEKKKYAVVADIRSRAITGDILEIMQRLKDSGHTIRLLFLDASDETIINRYKETRRRHPLMDDSICTIDRAITAERMVISSTKEKADYLIDTSLMSNAQLRERVNELLLNDFSQLMSLSIVSFGFKFGLPNDADIVFDVRCLPNPFYIKELKDKTGKDKPVHDYVFSFKESKELFERLTNLISFSLPLYVNEGKSHLVVAIGCTGGKHRSVAFAEDIASRLTELGERVYISHRDIKR